MVFYCFLSLSLVVSLVSCGTLLYRFLIFATFHTFILGNLVRLKRVASMIVKCAKVSALFNR